MIDLFKTLILSFPPIPQTLSFSKSISIRNLPTKPHASPPPPPPPSSLQPIPKLQEIVNLFQGVQEPKAKYEQLLFYGKNLKPLETQFKTSENKVQGCVSQIWVQAYLDLDKNVVFEADSNSDFTYPLIVFPKTHLALALVEIWEWTGCIQEGQWPKMSTTTMFFTVVVVGSQSGLMSSMALTNFTSLFLLNPLLGAASSELTYIRAPITIANFPMGSPSMLVRSADFDRILLPKMQHSDQNTLHAEGLHVDVIDGYDHWPCFLAKYGSEPYYQFQTTDDHFQNFCQKFNLEVGDDVGLHCPTERGQGRPKFQFRKFGSGKTKQVAEPSKPNEKGDPKPKRPKEGKGPTPKRTRHRPLVIK
ncbi:hypothetical protein Vadar_026568 [Vaccinium darrowii]|uniref:Uncharacterized protein n=1 Tax=Vaccinium darrowii TaxID=229202 RepID=A0ACB7ZE91_9ERIC|nr:hypothetical protein Vadar_026568 [Vaccinium darrowii]